jgi:hypothetical protein
MWQAVSPLRSRSVKPPNKAYAGQHSSEINQNGAHAFPILLLLAGVVSCTLSRKFNEYGWSVIGQIVSLIGERLTTCKIVAKP